MPLLQGKSYETDVVSAAEASQSIDTEVMLEKLRQEVAENEEKAKIAADPEANLPAGWNVARVRLYLHGDFCSILSLCLCCDGGRTHRRDVETETCCVVGRCACMCDNGTRVHHCLHLCRIRTVNRTIGIRRRRRHSGPSQLQTPPSSDNREVREAAAHHLLGAPHRI